MVEQHEQSVKEKKGRAKVLGSGLAFDESKYEYDESFVPYSGNDPLAVHTTAEMVKALESDKTDIQALVLGVSQGKIGYKKLNKQEFLEHWNKNKRIKSFGKFREAFSVFDVDGQILDGATGPSIGQDFVPLLGGPFHKQLYISDYLRMNALAYQAYNHDPIAHAIVNITRDFTLGRGYRVDCKSKQHLAIWRAFEEANDLQNLMDYLAREMSIYGEVMLWLLPNNQTKIVYKLGPNQEVPKGYIPRVRLIDPSCIWEIVTYPEDITRVLYYQWVSPTQYQIYTGRDQGDNVPGTKFIFQQIPADQVIHEKVNVVTNEKRGRSDLFPVLGYLKRLRDSINYSIIGLQKASAWAIDTTVEGDSVDIAAYVTDQQSQGTFAPAGSEFVHTSKIKREYLSNQGASGGQHSTAFEWCINMVCAATQIPYNYFGLHNSSGTTRASAFVATEPVDRKFQMRQIQYERIIKKLAKHLFKSLGMEDEEIEVTFPEIISSDRSAKLKDMALAVSEQWISKERAATMAAKEFGITEFEYAEEEQDIKADPAPELAQAEAPLSMPGKAPGQINQPQQESKRSKVISNAS